MLRMAPKGQIDQAAFVGTGFFVSRTHFVTASQWSTQSCSGVRVTSPIRFASSRTSWTGDGFNKLKVVFDDPSLDIAILQSAISARTG